VVNVKVGEDVTIDCYATGSPSAYITIRNTETPAPGNLDERKSTLIQGISKKL